MVITSDDLSSRQSVYYSSRIHLLLGANMCHIRCFLKDIGGGGGGGGGVGQQHNIATEYMYLL